MTIPSRGGDDRTDLTKRPLDTFGAPVTFTGDLMWLHPLTDDNAVARHVHDTVVIVFFRTGSGTHQIAERAHTLRPGDVVIVPPGAAHDLRGASGLSGWALEFSPSVLRRAGHENGSWWAHPLLQAYVGAGETTMTGGFHVPATERDRWEALLVQMDRELTEQRSGWSQAATACLLLLLVEVVRVLERLDAEPTFHADPVVTASLGVIERRYREDVNVGVIASEVGMTPEHLTTRARQETGRTIGQWLTDRRMAEARRLLITSDLTVEAVGRKSGYRDAAHFSRRFKQKHGVSPAAWRRAKR